MSWIPGVASSSRKRIGRRVFVTNCSPGRGKRRPTCTRVCCAEWNSPGSSATNAHVSATCPPSGSTIRKRRPAGTRTARPSRAGTWIDSAMARSYAALEPRLQVEVGPRVEGHALVGQVLLHPGHPELAAEPALLPPAEGRLRLAHVVRVHPHVPRLEAASDAYRATDVGGPDGGAEPVPDAVRQLDRLVLAVGGEDADDGAEDLLARDPRLRPHVRHDSRADEEAVDLASGGDRRPVLLHALEERPHALDLALRDERADQRLRVERVADRELLRALDQLGDEAVVERALHDDPRRGGAGLAAVEEGAVRERVERLLEVRVLEDEARRLPAALEREPLQRACGELHDPAPGGGRPGERDLVDAGMRDQGLARRRPGAVDHVHHARRQARHVVEEAYQRLRRGRRLLRRLDDGRASGRERGAQLAHREVDGVVPRDDQRADSDRLRDRQVEDGGRRRAGDLALDRPGGAGEVAELVRGATHLAVEREADRLPHLARDELRDLLRLRVEPRAQLEQHGRAVRGAPVLPVALVERAPRRRNRTVDSLRVGRGRPAEDAAVGGRARLERLALLAPRTADQVARRVDAGDHASTSTTAASPSSSSSSPITSGGESLRTLPNRPPRPTRTQRRRSSRTACAVASGSGSSPSRTSSIARNRPRPRTSPTCGRPSSSRRSRASACSPSRAERSTSPSSRTTSIAAHAAAADRTFVRKVEVIVSGAHVDVTCSWPSTAANGRPPPIPFPTVIRSGTTPSWSHAHIRPVRPKPHCTSSNTSSVPLSSHRRRSPARKPSGGTTAPPFPCTGSTTTQAGGPTPAAGSPSSSSSSASAATPGSRPPAHGERYGSGYGRK